VAQENKLRRALPSDGEEDRPAEALPHANLMVIGSLARIEIFGSEIIEKQVKPCANSGRIYLPPEWIGHRVKIIRID
jgi:putative transposon-encoded protein